MNIRVETLVQADFETVVAGFDQELFLALSPPLMPVKLNRFDGCKKGDEVHVHIPLAGQWTSLITEDHSKPTEFYFKDVGQILPFPLKQWEHQHFVKKNDKGTIIIDNIDYQSFNSIFNLLIFPFLWIIFNYRQPVYKKFFKKHI